MKLGVFADPHDSSAELTCGKRYNSRLLEESGRVAAVFQGHYHRGAETVEGGIHYLTLPAMCEREDGLRVIEI